MSQAIEIVPFPELVFAIAGAIGVDIDMVEDKFKEALATVDYRSIQIKLTSEMYKIEPELKASTDETSFYTQLQSKIKHANRLCERNSDKSFMAKLGVTAILRERKNITGDYQKPSAKTAYIIRQLKRREEVDLLRKVYGRQFILVSAYGSEEDRRKRIVEKLVDRMSSRMRQHKINSLAEELIDQDAREEENLFGQDLRETYHLADVFIDGLDVSKAEQHIFRFVHAFFGSTRIAPSKIEYGMYAAKSASLRSSDLSRQVGAAIVSENGEIITQGCNEVPKAHGGTYWDLEEPDHRDVRLGKDPNDVIKKYLMREVFDTLLSARFLSKELSSLGSATSIVDFLTTNPAGLSRRGKGLLARSSFMDLTEYGRVVHAEMCAICDAARIGRSIKDATLFCTTFPCHNCTKHILAAGIKRVIYIEPYPKSRAKQLHEHEIEIEREVEGCVAFLPFMGISPLRYRDVFQKGRRKN